MLFHARGAHGCVRVSWRSKYPRSGEGVRERGCGREDAGGGRKPFVIRQSLPGVGVGLCGYKSLRKVHLSPASPPRGGGAPGGSGNGPAWGARWLSINP